jgi:hypothetical protein
MAAYQATLAAQRAGQQAAPAAPATPPAPTNPPAPVQQDPTPQVNDGQPSVEDMVGILFMDYQNRAYREAIGAAIAAFPAVQPFADRLQGDTPQAILEDAARMAAQLQATPGQPGTPAPNPADGGSPPPPAVSNDPSAPGTTTPTVVPGGSPTVQPTGQETPQQQLARIIQSKDWSAYDQFKRENPGVTLVPGGHGWRSWGQSYD